MLHAAQTSSEKRAFSALSAPLFGFLPMLAEGWRFPGLVVQPQAGNHGFYSVLLVRDDQ
jgi:hypothetical protein